MRVPHRVVGLLLGPHWKRWSEVVVACGGPNDVRLQREIIEIVGTSDKEHAKIYLRGSQALVDALASAIQKIVETQDRRLYGVRISVRHHKALRTTVQDIQASTKAQIFFPGHDRYLSEASLANAAKFTPDYATADEIVQVLASKRGYREARRLLKVRIDALRATTRVLDVPAKLRHALHDLVVPQLRALGVAVPPRSELGAEFLPLPPAGGICGGVHSWAVVARYDDSDAGTIPWALAAPNPACLIEAEALVRDALVAVAARCWVGFLVVVDSRTHGLIVERGGTTLQGIRRETGAAVHMPQEAAGEQAILTIGSWDAVNKAKNAIVALIESKADRDKA